jgi:hypothetical protein
MTGSVTDYVSQFISSDQVLALCGPLAAISLLTMLWLYAQPTPLIVERIWTNFFGSSSVGAELLATPQRESFGIKIISPLLLFGGLVGLLYFLSVTSSGVRLIQQPQSDESPVATLLASTLVRQDFIAPAGQLEKIELSFDTSKRLNLSKVDFTLYQTGLTQPLWHTQIDAFYVKNNIYYPIKLPGSVKLDKATQFYFTLSSVDATTRSSLIANSVSLDKVAAATLPSVLPAQVKGMPTTQVLQFRVDYGLWGRLGPTLADFMGLPGPHQCFFDTLLWI